MTKREWWDTLDPQTPTEWALLRELHKYQVAAFYGLDPAYLDESLEAVPVVAVPRPTPAIAMPLRAQVSLKEADLGLAFNAQTFAVSTDTKALYFNYYATRELVQAERVAFVVNHMVERFKPQMGAFVAAAYREAG